MAAAPRPPRVMDGRRHVAPRARWAVVRPAEAGVPAVPQFTRLWLRQSRLRAVPAFEDSCLRMLLEASLNLPTFKYALRRARCDFPGAGPGARGAGARAGGCAPGDRPRARAAPSRLVTRCAPSASEQVASARCVRSHLPAPAVLPPTRARGEREFVSWEPRGGHA